MSSNEKKKNSSRLIAGLRFTAVPQDATISLSLLLLLLSPVIPSVRSQSVPGSNSPPNQYPYAKFSPSMAIIIVVLVAALFFMGFCSIYIRRCSNDGGTNLRHALSMRRGRNAAASRGLDAEVIESFPTFAYSTVKGLKIGKGVLECAVCLNEFQDDETLRLIPKCDHVFHPECIDAWLESHVTCPVCRANLVPQPGESTHLHPELQSVESDTNTAGLGNQQNGDVSIRISDDHEAENVQEPEVVNRNRSLKENRPPRSRSVRLQGMFQKFRSHSTGHSLVQPGENTDRYTLRLPEEVRKQVMSRALLKRTASSVVVFPREGSTRRGYRTGEGSSRGRSYRRLESLGRVGRSDRWVFSRAPSFLTRAFSTRSPRVGADNGEASTSSTTPKGSKTAVKIPFSIEPKSDEKGLVAAGSAQPPV